MENQLDESYKEDNKFINLLIITPAFPNEDSSFIAEKFVRDQIASLKNNFKSIYVISPVLYSFKMFKKDQMCHNYSYDNVKVFFPRCYYIPIFYFDKILIDNRLNVVISTIEKNSLKFDIIHAHITWPSGYIGVKLKEKYCVPAVLTIHENGDWFKEELDMNHHLLNYAWKHADALIRVNKKDVPILKKYNENTYSIPNGYSSHYKILDKKECREKLNLDQDKQILFTIGYLIKRKGFNFLIDAIKISVKNNPNILCVIGGSGPLKNKLQKQIDELNLNNHVILAGFIQEELLPVWMNACDMFVLPSLNEGNPTVMFECLGCGKPFIGTRVGGVPEIISSEDFGLLCDPADSEEFAENILIALDKEWDCRKIKEYSRQFTWENVATKILIVYHTVLRGYIL